MNERHVVVGAGPVGLATAELLVEQGKDVVLVSRSGTGPEIDGRTPGGGRRRRRRPAGRAGRRARPRSTTASTRRRTRCGRSSGRRSPRRSWRPPSSTGAVLVTAAALYPYGPVDGPMVEGLPDAATDQEGADPRRDVGRGEAAARRRPDQGRRGARLGLRGTAGLDLTGHIARVAPAALQGKTVRVFGRPDQPHSFTDVRDMARALVRGRRRAERVGTGLARADQPRQDPGRGARRRCRAVGREPAR